MITIRIVELGRDGVESVSRHRGSPRDAMRLAIQKRYGKRAALWQDADSNRGHQGWYGQVTVPTGQPGEHRRCVTGRVRISWEKP